MPSRDRLVRRRSVLKISGAALATSLAGCTDMLGGGGEGAEFNVAGAGGGWGEMRTKTMFDPFNNNEEPWGEHPHTLNYRTVPTQQRYSDSISDDPAWVLSELDHLTAARGAEAGAVLPMEEHVDSWENASPAFQTHEIAGNVVLISGFGINRNQIDWEITSWDDYLDPELEGRIGLPDWGWLGNHFTWVVNEVKGGTLDNPDPGFQFIEDLLELDPILVTDANHAQELLEQEEMWLCWMPSGRVDNAEINTDGEVPTEFVVPEEGTTGLVYDYALLDGHSEEKTEAAKDFLEGVHSAEVQAAFAESFGYPPVNPDAFDHISEETKEKRPSIVLSDEDLEAVEKIDVDWMKALETEEEFADRFRRTVGQ